jgi:hypothetical protein
MPIDFPTGPTIGQQYTYAGVTYTYTAQGTWATSTLPVSIPSGSLMMFQQNNAPLGWTKQSTHDDKALRIVSGSAASGGTLPFSTVFARTATDNFTLTNAELAAHDHLVYIYQYPDNGGGHAYCGAWSGEYSIATNTGGGGPHAHGLDLRVATIDAIIASRN